MAGGCGGLCPPPWIPAPVRSSPSSLSPQLLPALPLFSGMSTAQEMPWELLGTFDPGVIKGNLAYEVVPYEGYVTCLAIVVLVGSASMFPVLIIIMENDIWTEQGTLAERNSWGQLLNLLKNSGVEWGLIFPDANGEYQSPINLNSREAKYDPSLLEVRLSPNYVVCRDCEVVNDGHSIQIALKSKSVLIGGPLPRGHEFELHDVRFHWGRENQRGSEHTVNFKAFPMELHLMHWNSTLYSSIDEAVGKKHGIAIIALFVQIGKEHVGLKAVTEILQDIQYKGKSKTIPCFNPNSLLPDPLLRDYWVYEGSLTIPPCSEGVTWILFRYPLTVSQVQIEEFRRLRTHVKGAELLEGCDGILGDNFRPTQPLSDRVIRAAFQ
ncbi:PREDICTED: carbonic anhydrase-related protein [Chaetura pelagica]|nr:PREDICTED: carbonic anhydrase-related protein [Chaetura pelagica]